MSDISERKCPSLDWGQKRLLCMEKSENPTMTIRALSEWASQNFRMRVTDKVISRILQQHDRFLAGNLNENQKRAKLAYFPVIEAQLFKWFLAVRERKITVAEFESGTSQKLEVYQAVLMIVKSWRVGVTQQTIANCWKHTGFVIEADTRSRCVPRDFDLNEQVQDSHLERQVEDVTELLQTLVVSYPDTMTVEEVLAIDDSEFAPTYSVDDLLEIEGLVHSVPEDEDADTTEVLPDPPITHRSTIEAIESLRLYLLQHEKDMSKLRAKLDDIDTVLAFEYSESLVQTAIPSFFTVIDSQAEELTSMS
ncbi:hypothetical protein R1sor_000716 [Riccia sorocarpa]|uniref:DDE-1 domain-containing protein n=1 Tax=Riccia sorocarpa TaxID=122646 RepID=A0ABD3GWF0_9MARC